MLQSIKADLMSVFSVVCKCQKKTLLFLKRPDEPKEVNKMPSHEYGFDYIDLLWTYMDTFWTDKS